MAQDVRDKVHHGAVTVAPAEGGWSHCTPSQEAEAGDCRCSAHFLFGVELQLRANLLTEGGVSPRWFHILTMMEPSLERRSPPFHPWVLPSTLTFSPQFCEGVTSSTKDCPATTRPESTGPAPHRRKPQKLNQIQLLSFHMDFLKCVVIATERTTVGSSCPVSRY